MVSFGHVNVLEFLNDKTRYKVMEEIAQLAFEHRVEALVSSLSNPPFVEYESRL